MDLAWRTLPLLRSKIKDELVVFPHLEDLAEKAAAESDRSRLISGQLVGEHSLLPVVVQVVLSRWRLRFAENCPDGRFAISLKSHVRVEAPLELVIPPLVIEKPSSVYLIVIVTEDHWSE